MELHYRLTVVILPLLLVISGVSADNVTTVHGLFFKSVDITAYVQCIRLTNATHQIGCSASNSNTRGVLYHVEELEDISRLNHSAPHAPYIVLLEEYLFRGDARAVRLLKSMEPTVKGIMVRYDFNFTMDAGAEAYFSPEKKCPNEGYGQEPSGCDENSYWNEFGTDLLYTDFGDFPIFIVESFEFDGAVECCNQYNNGTSGGYGDFPLCSAELTADMRAAVDTPTCARRNNLPIPYLNGYNFCDPLGDQSVWGTLFSLTPDNSTSNEPDIIMLAAKIDSISFFPTALSRGASSEVAAIATLLAVIEQLGKLKRNWNVTVTRPILYSFFHGESWDYIGSSRMAYDMEHEAFPENEALPGISLTNISHFLEIGQLGLISNRTVYVHGDKTSDLINSLTEAAVSANIMVKQSSREALPPASLQRFIREGKMAGGEEFSASGSVLTSFDNKFDNRFFGSRYDDLYNFGNRTVDEVAVDLAALATAVAKAVFNISEPTCSETCEEVAGSIDASAETVSDLLYCFLSDPQCDLFKSVVTRRLANALPSLPISRYVGPNSQRNIESVLTQQLVAFYSANNASELLNPVLCEDCLKRISNRSEERDKAVNITWMQYNSSAELSTLCLCVESFTYTHVATSPVFKYKEIPHDSDEYSTWTESGWTRTNLRLYLVTYPLQEAGFFFIGLFLTALTLLFSIQCTRKGTSIFAVSNSYVLVST